MKEIIYQENYMKGNGIFELAGTLRRLLVISAQLTCITARARGPEE
jgi:hypothetical protein